MVALGSAAAALVAVLGCARNPPALEAAPQATSSPQTAAESSESTAKKEPAIDWSEPREPAVVVEPLQLPPATSGRRSRCAKLLGPAPPPPEGACDTPGTARELLERALADERQRVLADRAPRSRCNEEEAWLPNKRANLPVTAPDISPIDESLRALESCRGLPGGLVRALRAELSFSCAEELARDGLGNGTPLEPRYQHALAGLLLAARLLQRADPPPAFRPRTTSAEAGVSFVEQVLVPWGQGAEQRLAELERQVLALPEVSYGGALARIARAVARKRFRGVYGSFQAPREYKARYDLRAPLYASVDESYLPFVAAEHQAVRDGWSALAVSSSVWLSKPFVAHELFEGREHSLLRLLLPQPPGVASEEHGARLALSVPPFYLADLLSEAELQQASTLEAAALRGLSPRVRALLHGRQLSPAAQLALARSELMVSFLSIDPMRARRVVALTADIPGDDAALMGALAASFASVPADHRAWQGTQAFPVDLTPLTAPRSKARTTIGLSSLNAVYLLTAAGELSPELVSGLLERATENLEPAIAQACWPFTHWFSDSLRERPRCPCPYRWVR